MSFKILLKSIGYLLNKYDAGDINQVYVVQDNVLLYNDKNVGF